MADKRVLCSSCDIYCQVLVETDGDRVLRVKAADTRPGEANICMKGVHAPAGFNHKDRVLYPLRRLGYAMRYMPPTSWFNHDGAERTEQVSAAHNTRPLFLMRGVDRCGKNDFERGHPQSSVTSAS